ncbi:Indoleamine 2,3-dioxygenase [Xylogone sp. PMI_703]|nr:Indoleamine 2,3-dioxygenase [Xylogone sp. PMI_703]
MSTLCLLENFDVSDQTGFLAPRSPSHGFQLKYPAWQYFAANLPSLIKGNKVRQKVQDLPDLSISKLQSQEERREAYAVLAFIAQAYIWGAKPPSDHLPAKISCPFLEVAHQLDLPPTTTYAAVVLWNFISDGVQTERNRPENIRILYTFTGTSDEMWFYAISIAIEARGATVIRTILNALDAATCRNTKEVISGLNELADCIGAITELLKRVYERCDPEIFYHHIRPFLAGTKDMTETKLPYGVFYDEGDGQGQWHRYSGGSNAQSSLIQLFDIVLGIKHEPAENMDTLSEDKSCFTSDMLKYMPGVHRRFLAYVSTKTSIRTFIEMDPSSESVNKAFNKAVQSLVKLRETHIQVVTRYIIHPSRKMKTRMNILSGPIVEESQLRGTGGTQLVQFLKQSREETRKVLEPAANRHIYQGTLE